VARGPRPFSGGWIGIVLVLPLMLFLLAMLVYPLTRLAALALHNGLHIDAAMLVALRNSITLSLGVAAVSIVLCITPAWALARWPSRLKVVLRSALAVPLMFSGVVVGFLAILMLGLGVTASGYTSAASAPTSCEIKTASNGGMLAIQGVVHAGIALSGSYQLRVSGEGPGGSSDLSQGGQFNAGAGEAVTLGYDKDTGACPTEGCQCLYQRWTREMLLAGADELGLEFDEHVSRMVRYLSVVASEVGL